MKPYLFILLVLPFRSAHSQIILNSGQKDIVFRSVNVIPMDKERVIPDQTVVVKNGKIVLMGDSRKIKYDKNAFVVEGKGKYLIPGLSEMHAHVPPIDDIEPMKRLLLLYLTNGITTIRGMLGHPKHLELRSKINSGEILGPRFYTSGPSISGTTVLSPETGRKKVLEQKKAGYDFLKFHPGLTKENFEAIIKTANEAGISFAGHVSFQVGVWRAIEANYSTIDHLDGFITGLVPPAQLPDEDASGFLGMFVADRADTTQIPRLMKALRDHHVWVVPTESLFERWCSPATNVDDLRNASEVKYMDSATVNDWVSAKVGLMKDPKYDSVKMIHFMTLRKKLILECQRTGVGLLLGSDAPQIFNVPGFSIHHELEYLVQAGLSPYEALYTGTVNVAKFYHSNDRGVIKAGAVSDLVLLAANPLENILNTQKIEGVMMGNKWLPKPYLEKTLKELEANTVNQ